MSVVFTKQPNLVFSRLVIETNYFLPNNNSHLLFREGSKSEQLSPTKEVAAAAEQAHCNHILQKNALIFVIEGRTILQITNVARKNKLKTGSVTNSESVIKVIRDPLHCSWNTINKVRNTINIF